MNKIKILELVAEHEGNDTNGRMFEQHLGKTQISDLERKLIIDYLRNGHLLEGFMEWWFDCRNLDKSIGPAGYYTDGKWIWAGYHSYYLENYSTFGIDTDFIQDIKMQDFKFPSATKAQLDEAQKYLELNVFAGDNLEQE